MLFLVVCSSQSSLLCQRNNIISAFLKAVATLHDMLGHILSKPTVHVQMEPLKEVQGDFSVVNSPQDVINTFHLAGTTDKRVSDISSYLSHA